MSNGPEVSEQKEPDEEVAAEAVANGEGEGDPPANGEGQGDPPVEQASAQAAADGEDGHEDEDEDEPASGPGLGKTVHLDPADLPGALEALILVSDKPAAPVRLARLTRSDLDDVKRALVDLKAHYEGRGIVLDEIAGGYQFRTHPRHAPVVRSLIQQKPVRLTRAQLEVLSIIAYRQPVTRPEVEEVRGVDSGSAMRVLLDRGVIRIIGKRDDAGRPMLYATTPDFLSLFGLKNLSDLPTLKEFTELSDESRDMFERRIGERPNLEGFTADATDARAAAEREASLKEEASSEPDPEEAQASDEDAAAAADGGEESGADEATEQVSAPDEADDDRRG